jgi:hypothetical protein
MIGCRKGNRDCVYPEPPSSTKARRDSNKSKSGREGEGEGEGSSPEGGDLDDLILEDEDVPAYAVDEPASAIDEPESATSTDEHTFEQRASTDSPSLADASPSSSVESSNPFVRAQTSTPVGQSTRSRRRPSALSERSVHELPADIRYYLQYASTKLSCHHWGVRIDHQNFFRKTMIEVALRYDPLLYALVGFAAYHCTLEKPDGKLEDFLGYYQKSITLLRQTFRQKATIATILTILQLATIEVCQGQHQDVLYLTARRNISAIG